MRRIISLSALLALVLASYLANVFSAEAEEGEVFAQVRWYSAFGSEQDDAAVLGISTAQYEELRERLFGALRNFEDSCTISDFGIKRNQATTERLTRIIYKDDPAMFQVNGVSFSYSLGTNTFTKINFSPYKYDKARYEEMLTACDEAADSMTADLLHSGLGQAELALILHDRLAVRCEYDYENYCNHTVPDASYTMYGALVNRICVCEGYTQAYIYLLARVGIQSRMCSSDSLNHAWNIVEIDGELYHVDVTWDDPVYDRVGRVEHGNFLRSTAGIVSTGHEAADFDSAPQSTKYDDAFWCAEGFDTQFCYADGRIYYIDPADNTLVAWQGEETVTLSADLSDRWYAGAGGSYWQGNYASLASDGTYLYFNRSDAIWRYDPAAGEAKECFRPDLSGLPSFFYIYALTVDGGDLVYEIYNSPNFTAQVKTDYTFRIPIPEPAPVTLTALSVSTLPLRRVYAVGSVFDGTGMVLTAFYSDGSSALVSSGYTVDFSAAGVGETAVTVSYEGLSDQFTVTVTNVRGDVDGDGEITSTDARMTLMAAMDKLSDMAPDPALAEVDGDGTLTSTDARLILQFAVELIDDWPAAA